MAFEHKQVFHSKLVTETEDGAIPVLICSEPKKSDYLLKGQPYNVCFFQYADQPHELVVENDAIFQALTGFSGRSLYLKATGRGDTAAIELWDFDGPPIKRVPKDASKSTGHKPTGGATPAKPGGTKPAGAAKPAAGPAGATPAAPKGKPKDPALALKVLVAKLINIELTVLHGSMRVAEQFPNLTAEDLHGMRGRWYISLERTGIFEDAPVKQMEFKAPGAAEHHHPQEEHHEEPQEEPQPEPEPPREPARAAARPADQAPAYDPNEDLTNADDIPF